MKTATKSVTVRLPETDVELLKRLSEQEGVSQTKLIRDALQNYEGALQGAVQENSDSDEGNTSKENVHDLASQLQHERDRVDELMRLLDQEQRLHLATKQELHDAKKRITDGGNDDHSDSHSVGILERIKRWVFGDDPIER